jgi:glycosyltransferase involved in cell wall biosynthesis
MMGLYLLVAGQALFWLGVASRVRAGRADGRYRLGPDAPVLPDLPTLHVLIPARDEARNIGDCVASVRGSDHPDVRVWVVDDDSGDGTADLARAAGATVIPGDGSPLPPGWKGKPRALERGRGRLPADAAWIVFIDADVRLHPAALSRVHSYAIREGADFVSGFGRLLMGSFWENVIQPSVGGLIIAGNDLALVNDDARREKVIANGQLILVRAAPYAALGGHAVVKDDILDDVGLARAFVGAGHRVRVLFLRELFSCRMYTGFRELWAGWTKNLYPGMEFRTSAVVAVILLVVVEFLAPYAVFVYALAAGHGGLVAASGALLLLMHAVRAWMDRIFEQPLRYGLLQPLGALLLVGLVLDSVRRTRAGTREWKGRTY